MAATTTNYLIGVYDDDAVVTDAIYKVRGEGVRVHELYSPYPIHGVDDALGYKRTRLDIAAFMFGATGGSLGLTMMFSMLGWDWPMIIGGKPYTPFPDFVPITFESTVLICALGMVGTFFTVSSLYPGSKKLVLDPRFSDDKFILAINLDKNHSHTADEIAEMLRETGASEVNTREV